MSDDWDFGQLDLEDSEVDSGNRRLRPGRYICTIVEASLEQNKNDPKGRSLKCTFVDKHGHGMITEYISIHLPKSEEATAIGKKQLKTMLTHGGHPTPSSPGDVKSIVGLVVGVNVVPEKFKSARTGDDVMGSSVDSWHPYFNPEGAVGLGPEAPPARPAATANADDDFDDIPF